MKLSEITLDTLKNYLRVTGDSDDISVLAAFEGAKGYMYGYTGLSSEEAEKHEDIAIAVLVLSCDMYDNRQYTVASDKANRVVQSILDMYCVNLL